MNSSTQSVSLKRVKGNEAYPFFLLIDDAFPPILRVPLILLEEQICHLMYPKARFFFLTRSHNRNDLSCNKYAHQTECFPGGLTFLKLVRQISQLAMIQARSQK